MGKTYEEATHAELVEEYKRVTGIQKLIEEAENASHEELIAEIKFSNKMGLDLGYLSVSQLRSLVRAEKVSEGAWFFANDLVENIVGLVIDANLQDEESKTYLSCIYKILHSPFFDTEKKFLKSTIRKISKLRTPTAIARGLRIRKIMKALSFAVEPRVPGKKVMQEGVSVKLAEWGFENSWEYKAAKKYFEKS